MTAKQKPLWPSDHIVTPVAALSIAHMGVITTPCERTVSGTFSTCKEVFSFSTAPTFPYILVPIWSTFSDWLGGSPGTGASASAPIKAHHWFPGKLATSGNFLSFLVMYLDSLVLLTTFSAEPYPFHKRQPQSNIVLIPLFQVWTKLTIFPGSLVPMQDHFFCQTNDSTWDPLW